MSRPATANPARPGPGANAVTEIFSRREAPIRDLADHAGEVAAACHAMAVRFHRGGKLLVFGTGTESTDAMHVAVEFVHPVIVGMRALPAVSLTTDVATLTGLAEREGMPGIFAHQIRVLGEPSDIAIGICADDLSESVLAGLTAAHDMGMLTIALAGGDDPVTHPAVDHVITAGSRDPRVVKEVHVTTYHLLWELVHVFFSQPGVLSPGAVA